MRLRRVSVALIFLLVLTIIVFWWSKRKPYPAEPPVQAQQLDSVEQTNERSKAVARAAGAVTHISAHNLMLRKGPSFRFYVRWLRGDMIPARRGVNPSFDDPESFLLDIKTGVLRANIGDINNFLNAGGLGNSPLRDIHISGDGERVKIQASMKKMFTFPVEIDGTIAAAPENLIRIHVNKINVLKLPLKGLLGGFHVSLADLVEKNNVAGVSIANNDITFDTRKLLPPPHIRGQLTKVHIVNPDLEEIFGDAQGDVDRVEQWRNFLRLSDGTIDFGRLTMHPVDLTLIDISKDPWFDLDLTNYQQQLVNGYSRMTPEAGLQVFMPDLRDIPPSKANRDTRIEWIKNRNLPPPASVYSK